MTNSANAEQIPTTTTVASTANVYTTEPDHRTQKCLWERILLNGKLVSIMESEKSAKKFIAYLERREIYSVTDWLKKAEPQAQSAYMWQTRSGGVCADCPFRHEADYSPAQVMTPDTTSRRFTLEEVMEAQRGMNGLCLDCGAMSGCCEPDGKALKCESCGEPTVYGPDEILFSIHGVG